MRAASPALALLLAACGVAESAPVDDAANPPRWGLWQVERMPTRIVRNGVEVPKGESQGHGDERFTDVYGRLGLGMPSDKEACGEPRAGDAEWIGRHLSGQLDRLCRVTEIERDGERVSGKGVCGEGERGLAAETSFDFEGTDGRDELEVKANAEFVDRRDTGETHVIELGMKITGKRLGECVAQDVRGTFES